MRAPISIVIPTLNSQKTIKKTLVSLFEGIEAGIVRELIVVDGGSSDKTKEISYLYCTATQYLRLIGVKI